MRHRYYDAATGRFTQQDPIGLAGGLNLYGFASGDPVNFSDPFGLSPCPPCGGAGHAMMYHVLGKHLEQANPTIVEGIVPWWIGPPRAAMAMVRSLGLAGETGAGIVKNYSRIPSATRTALFQIPDELTATTLTEVKNVSRLGLTNQIRDFAAFAEETGRSFELVVREETKLTKPLLSFIEEKGIHLRRLR